MNKNINLEEYLTSFSKFEYSTFLSTETKFISTSDAYLTNKFNVVEI